MIARADRTRARLAAVAAAAWFLAAPAARAEIRPPYGGALTASLLSEPVTLDPVRARSHAEITLASLVFDTLYRAAPSGEVVPHLAAAAPEWSDDGRRARIELRSGVAFHDGTELEASDVARSLERARVSGARWALAPIAAVTVEEGAIAIELASARPPLAELLAAPAASVTPDGRPPDEGAPVGSGPFRLDRLSRARRRVVLRAFDRHFAGRPYLDRVTFRWYERGTEEARRYEAGRVHMSLRGAVAFAGHQPKYATDVVEGPAAILVYVGFGTREAEVTGVTAFRRAVSLAIGRRGMRALGAGERVIPARLPAAPDLGGPAPDRGETRAQTRAAREELARAGRRSPPLRRALSGAGELSLEVLIDESRPEDRPVAEKVVAALYRLGLEARIAEVPAPEFATRVLGGRCDLYIGHLAAPSPSVELEIGAALAAGGSTEAAAELVRGDRDPADILSDFERTWPIVPMFHRAVRVHHRANLYGLGFDGTTRISYADVFVFGDPPPAGSRAP